MSGSEISKKKPAKKNENEENDINNESEQYQAGNGINAAASIVINQRNSESEKQSEDQAKAVWRSVMATGGGRNDENNQRQ